MKSKLKLYTKYQLIFILEQLQGFDNIRPWKYPKSSYIKEIILHYTEVEIQSTLDRLQLTTSKKK